jgi:hypothetical protein
MLVIIKGSLQSGKSTLADRLVSALGLAPVAWPLAELDMRAARIAVGDWIDLEQYFGGCRHLDLERAITVVHIENRGVLPPPPRWRPGASPKEMLDWRTRIFREIFAGRLLKELYDLTCRLIDAAEHTVLEGEILGSSLKDSRLTDMLRSRYLHLPTLRVLLQRRPAATPDGEARFLALVNGRWLSHDEVVAALRREPDGSIAVAPEVGWTSTGAEPPRPPGPPAALEEGPR